jgi:hypothetical protein
MFRTAGLAAIILFSTAFLSAQGTPRFEIFGGYSLAHIDDQALTEHSITNSGWNASLAVNNQHFGFVFDFGGYYGTHRLSSFGPANTPSPFQETTKLHTAMFGPQFSIHFPWVSPFAHALIGAVREDGNSTLVGSANPAAPPPPQPGSIAGTGFAYALGGGGDIYFSHHSAFRVQIDYLHCSPFDPAQSNLRFSTGLVFRFGR